ncbi:TetR/AcrR family transcriptional regulator [Nocardia veterana]|uniref:TetR/AcrR family transcriptional regulator n=1 Tax=Nocardia veterana TaxID=132249 RepID=A0A7X6RGL4_9NOCA|nr:TetR/AcrR family transcriptional regulator [Nocardia veterana]NKY85040.1 TetR/AcrR family transcriptional regulator [Nocardia veterana]
MATGRPRKAEVDHAVVAATVDLLIESGYAALTIEAVAARAGVGRPTIYRRWPTKDDLVVHALIEAVPPLRAPDTGEAMNDLIELAVGFVTRLAASPLGRAVLAVHAEGARRPALAEPLRERYLRPRDEIIADVIARARRQGALRPELSNEVVRDLVFGPLVYHWLIDPETLDRDVVDALAAAARQAIASPALDGG